MCIKALKLITDWFLLERSRVWIRKKVKRFIGKSVAVLAVAFVILSIVSKRKKKRYCL